MVLAGAAAWFVSRSLGERWDALGLFGVFLAVYAAVVVAGEMPQRFVAERLDSVLDRWVRDETGGGYYGMVARSVLAWREVSGLLDFSVASFDVGGLVRSHITQSIIGFSIDAITHAIHAAIWPWWLIGELDIVPLGMFAVACWCVFTLGRKHLPMPDLREKPEEIQGESP